MRPKKERQAWWRSLTKEEQEARIKVWMERKAKQPLPPFDHRTKLPFLATIKPLDGAAYMAEVARVDGEIVIEHL